MFIEVKRITLEGEITKVEPLSRKWHERHVGRNEASGIPVASLPEGKYFTLEVRFPNPFNAKYPARISVFPVPEDAVPERGATTEADFLVHGSDLYREEPRDDGKGLELVPASRDATYRWTSFYTIVK